MWPIQSLPFVLQVLQQYNLYSMRTFKYICLGFQLVCVLMLLHEVEQRYRTRVAYMVLQYWCVMTTVHGH